VGLCITTIFMLPIRQFFKTSNAIITSWKNLQSGIVFADSSLFSIEITR
jgi:hypothetical protein